MWNNEQFGSILLKIGRLFLIWPSLQLKGSSNHKYVCLIYTVFSISLYLYSTKGRFETIYTVSNSTATVFSVLDQFSQSCSCFFNIIPCIYLAFVKVDSYIKFFRKIKELGNVLRNDWLQSRKQCWIFFIFQSIVFMGLIFNVYVLTNYYEVGIYSYFLMRDIEFFQWSLNACIMFFCTMWIRNLFVELNNRIVITTKEKLARNLTVEEINRKTFNDVYRTKNEQSYSNVSLHFEICKLVNLFNDVFGLNILFLIVNCIVLLLFNVAVCAMYGLKSGNPVYGSTHDVSLLFCRFQRIFVLLVVPMMLAYSCESVEAASSSMIPITLIYLNELPPLSKNKGVIELKEELTNLYEQGSSKIPHFTAAGFFVVNYAMLGFIIGSVTSYIIVTLQLVDN